MQWNNNALAKAMTGLILAVFLDGCVFHGPLGQTFPLDTVRDLGIHLDRTITTTAHNYIEPKEVERSSLSKILFIDIQKEGCLESGDIDCRRGYMLHLELLQSIYKTLISVAGAKPTVIVIDGALPTGLECSANPFKGGTPVIGALPDIQISSDQYMVLSEDLPCGKIQPWDNVFLAPTHHSTEESSLFYQGITASYNYSDIIVRNNTQLEQHTFESIPYLAVQTLANHTNDPNEFLSDKYAHSTHSGSPETIGSMNRNIDKIEKGKLHKIRYTLTVPSSNLRYLHHKYESAAQLNALLRTEGLSNSVVIIGTSSPRAGDLHVTPLNVISGAEIIANTIRSHQLPADESPSIGNLAIYLSVYALSFLTMYKTWQRMDERSYPQPYALAVNTASLGFALSICFFIVLFATFLQSRLALSSDVITPLLGYAVLSLTEVSGAIYDTLRAAFDLARRHYT